MQIRINIILIVTLVILIFTFSCKKSATEPDSDPLTMQIIPTHVSLYGGSDGAIDLTVAGGISPYVYEWSNGLDTKGIRNLTAGTYSVIVTDADQETIADSITITEPNMSYFRKSSQTLGNTRTFGCAIADTDLDNDQDVFIANLIGPSQLWINNGNGTFSRSNQNFNVPASVHDVGMTDLNGDIYPDLFLLSHGSPSKIYFNGGDGIFTQSNQDIGLSDDYPQYLDLGDVDNDGDIDAIIYNWQEAPNRLWLNDGNGYFTMVDIDYGGINAKGFELADFNGDSFLDLFLNMRQRPNQIWLNDGSGNFVYDGLSFGNGGEYSDIVDFDGDGDMDIAITIYGSSVTIWLNQNNTGIFSAGPFINEGASHCKLLDVEQDGDYDLITTHNDNGQKLYINDGNGSFESLGNIFGNDRTLSLEISDLDGDGDIDMVFGQLEGTGGNSIYINNSIIQ